jgi:hypothetical protein
LSALEPRVAYELELNNTQARAFLNDKEELVDEHKETLKYCSKLPYFYPTAIIRAKKKDQVVAIPPNK